MSRYGTNVNQWNCLPSSGLLDSGAYGTTRQIGVVVALNEESLPHQRRADRLTCLRHEARDEAMLSRDATPS